MIPSRRRLIVTCADTVHVIAARVAAFVAVALSVANSTNAQVLFDAPQYIGGHSIPYVEDLSTGIGLAPSSDGSIWVIISDYQGSRLARWSNGNLHEVATLQASLVGGPYRFVERTDGLLQLVSESDVWVLQLDGAVVRTWALPTPGGAPWEDVDVDQHGTVFALRNHWQVPGPDYGVVDVYDDAGSPIRSWTTPLPGFALAVATGNRVIVVEQGPYGSPTNLKVYSPFGTLLVSAALQGDLHFYNQRLRAMPSGALYLLTKPGVAETYPIRAFSESGIELLRWHWSDPADDGEPRYPPPVATEDGDGRLVTASFDWNAPPRLEVYAPLGPGVILQPANDDVPYSIDGMSYTGRRRFDFAPGTTHSLSVAPSTLIAPGTRRDFVAWSDAGAASHDLVLPLAGMGLRLDLRTLHFVETSVDSGGVITPASDWIEDGDELTLSAVEADGYRFVKWSHPDSTDWWSGEVLDPQWTHVVTKAESWKAAFIRKGLVLTISASDSDPWVNAAAPASGPRQLWLWAPCLDRGISALEADVSGSLTPLGFTPEPGYLNVGSPGSLLLAIGGCPIGAEANVRLGSWWVMDNGGDFCLAPSSANGVLAVVDCPSPFPALNPVGVVGFSSVGTACRIGAMCGEDDDAPDSGGVLEAPVPPPIAHAIGFAVRGNPFPTSADLVFGVPTDGHVVLRIFDVAGRRVRTLWNGDMIAGGRTVTWDGRNDGGQIAPAGLYFARLETPRERRTVKLVKIQR